MSSSLRSPYTPHHSSRPSMPQIPVAGILPTLSAAPAGTFAPGTKVQVGNHRVIIERYLSEGGFAHVYLVRLPQAVDGEEMVVLKRVAVPDKEALTSMRTEVETMKKLKGHRHIVRYIDSHASQLKAGGYEVFLLMEYCDGGGLIDFMNTRLQNRLTEPEIVKIISDVAQGVACMHYLKPPLLHRDLKVENVLITTKGSARQFKLCDFGSAAQPRPAAANAAEGRLIEEDVQKHTTMQYRSPEMIDVYRKQPIDEKSDVWALGVLLYKLCYYTTPFEERGQMAILNATFKFPGYPSFSDRLKKLIAMMLQENPKSRPNIYQVVHEICAMRGTEVPIKDIYAGRTTSEVRRNQELPPPPSTVASPTTIGAYKVAPVEERQAVLPDITPMRRGRPNNLTVSEQTPTRVSPSPQRLVGNDPFAALDGSKVGSGDPDEISQRFPSLDQFSLLHDSGNTFAFEPRTPVATQQPQPPSVQPRELSQRVTEALADEAFVQPVKTEPQSRQPQQPPKLPISAVQTATQTTLQTQEVDAISHQSVSSLINSMNAGTQTDTPSSPKVSRKPPTVSTGTMTSPKTSHSEHNLVQRPLHRFPPSDHSRSLSQPRAPVSVPASAPLRKEGSDRELSMRTRPVLAEQRSKSQTPTFKNLQTPQTARPSLDSMRPQLSQEDILSRTKSEATRQRPISTSFEPSRFSMLRSNSAQGRSKEHQPLRSDEQAVEDDNSGAISSNVEFLKQMEGDEPNKKREKRQSSGSKYAKLSLSGTKNLFAGRFGDAFKRFESGQGDDHEDNNLTPIAGSEATDGRSDDGEVLEETEEMPPEVRRELERRRLSQEERRVAEAAAAYKQRVAESGTTRTKDNTRAASIQNKVQSLLAESNKSPTKTAEGYGRFTASAPPEGSGPMQPPPLIQPTSAMYRKPILPLQKQVTNPTYSNNASPLSATATAPRPSAPPKPQVLRTGGSMMSPLPSPNVVSKPSHLAVRSKLDNTAAGVNTNALSPEDWEAQFSKRYPSLSGLELVETEIGSERRIIRDV